MDEGDFWRSDREIYLRRSSGREYISDTQIAGHEVVYSVLLGQAEYPFNREGVERQVQDS
jgi:hypothetical protein